MTTHTGTFVPINQPVYQVVILDCESDKHAFSRDTDNYPDADGKYVRDRMIGDVIDFDGAIWVREREPHTLEYTVNWWLLTLEEFEAKFTPKVYEYGLMSKHSPLTYCEGITLDDAVERLKYYPDRIVVRRPARSEVDWEPMP